MARTYSGVPEPRFVERAKFADNGGGGGGDSKFVEVKYQETPFNDILAIIKSGKIPYIQLDDPNSDVNKVFYYFVTRVFNDQNITISFILIDVGMNTGEFNKEIEYIEIIKSSNAAEIWSKSSASIAGYRYSYNESQTTELMNQGVIPILPNASFVIPSKDVEINEESLLEFGSVDGSFIIQNTSYMGRAYPFIEIEYNYTKFDYIMLLLELHKIPICLDVNTGRAFYATSTDLSSFIKFTSDNYSFTVTYDSQSETTTYSEIEIEPKVVILYDTMTYQEILDKLTVEHGEELSSCIFVLKSENLTSSLQLVSVDFGSSPAYFEFKGFNGDRIVIKRINSNDTWDSIELPNGIFYVEPNSTSFMTVVTMLQNNIQPVINDTVNGRAYYISDYTMVGGQPAAITFSTIGANTPHTWTVDYQNNWSST